MPMRAAPPEERIGYRSKSWMRASPPESGEPTSFGIYRAVNTSGKWGEEFISWDACPIHMSGIQSTLAHIRAHLSVDTADVNFFGLWFGRPDLVWISQSSTPPEGLDWGAILSPPFHRVWFHQTSQVGKKVFGAKPITQIYGPPPDSLHPIRAFRQVAGSLLIEARDQARSALAEGAPSLVLDLYCGTGELSLLIPKETAWIGIEQSKEAVAQANSLSRGTTLHIGYEGAVEQRLADSRILEKIVGKYSIYINPPRPGLTREAREKIFRLAKESGPERIVYLSCSASSLARDLTDFEAQGFKVDHLQPYDFFPQTEHFETLAVLRKV